MPPFLWHSPIHLPVLHHCLTAWTDNEFFCRHCLHLLRYSHLSLLFCWCDTFHWFSTVLPTWHSFLGHLWDFLFTFGLKYFVMIFPSWISFYSTHLMFVEFLEFVNWFLSSVQENFSHYLFKYDFCPISHSFFLNPFKHIL